MAQDAVGVVWGKHTIAVAGQTVRDAARHAERVIVDVGAGDGRWIYRMARRSPSWLCLGIDANAQQMQTISSRARRKPARGGAKNVWFICSAVEALPIALAEIADEIHVHFPWGSLLWAIYRPDIAILARIAGMGKPGATFTARINTSILNDALIRRRLHLPLAPSEMGSRLHSPYAAAGIRLERVEVRDEAPHTTWGRRLGSGHPDRVLILEGVVDGPTPTSPIAPTD